MFTLNPSPKMPQGQISNRVVKVGFREALTGEEWKWVEEGIAGRENSQDIIINNCDVL